MNFRGAIAGVATGTAKRGSRSPGREPSPAHAAGSRHSRPRPPGRRSALGLTLVEMLVVLVLLSLLGTLLVQGTGFFLGKYATVKRVHRDASLAALRQHWFISSVQAMVPSRVETRRFEGDSTSFEGVTLQALAAEPGLPVRARWSIEPDGATEAVLYTQEDGEPWTVLAPEDPEYPDDQVLEFQYADSGGTWHGHWPTTSGDAADPPRERIPRMVRLVSKAGRTVWLARTDLFPEPVPNYREDL